jgi:2,4-dienoyl-CoA reductase-like NADH-dependent reductase (Old Yellow Enzyme family)
MAQGPQATLFSPLVLSNGPPIKNRLFLAPLTNTQSHADGQLSDDEFHWLTMRAEGGFGLTMTCAAHVAAGGQGFPGQLGVFSDAHLDGLSRLASGIRSRGSVSSVQLHHAGNRSPRTLVPEPVCPSDDPSTGARGLSLAEVAGTVESFVAAAVRCERAGFDGVEIHGAHGYLLAQFLSPTINQRTDAYGGSIENRARIIHEIIAGVRARCRPGFQLGLRLSPERYGVRLTEMVEAVRGFLAGGALDYIDLSLWDAAKEPEEAEHRGGGRTLMSFFTGLERGSTRLGVSGKVTTPAFAQAMLDAGADFVCIGRGAILHHDWPIRARECRVAAAPLLRAWIPYAFSPLYPLLHHR